jgi:hypothetical protein
MANGCREEYQKSLCCDSSLKTYDNVYKAEHQISFCGVKLIRRPVRLCEPPESSKDSKPAHNRLQFSLKLPKQRRFSTLKSLEF